jgi:Mg-chelatase subunit ChlD
MMMPIKILFVVDTSGSNSRDFNPFPGGGCDVTRGCVPATDPEKKFRAGSISDFFEKYKGKNNFSWGFETFSRDSVESFVGHDSTDLFGDTKSMENAINLFVEDQDKGRTPYLAALKSVRAALESDPELHSTDPVPPRYNIVFMSDGYPTDSSPSEINAEVESISSMSPTRISFSTIYYSTLSDPIAADILQNMAWVGGGQFVNVDTNAHETLNIQDLIMLPTTTCL